MTRLRTTLRWHRRSIAAVLLGLGVVFALLALRPQVEPLTQVVVAVRELPGGTTVAPDQVQVVSWPTRALPQGAFTRPDEVVGQQLVGPVARGSAFARAFVVQGGLQAASGRQLVPVRLADAQVLAFLQVGRRVSVVGLDADGRPVVLARGARVAVLPGQAQGGLLGSNQSGGALVVVDVADAEAVQLAALGQGTGLNLVLG